ncbi:MAG: hypothetical protein EP311_09900 [Cytophagales bacterium]|nr:MAG: hypothetical protein EP311_09900 [Cytophagales bacterium]
MRPVIFTPSLLLLLGLSGCFPEKDKLVVKNCEAFDFSIPESNWILFPQGRSYSFRSGDSILRLNSEYNITEEYTLEYERRSFFAFYPHGQAQDCSASFSSSQITEDGALVILNSIGYQKNKENPSIHLLFDSTAVQIKIVNDTLVGNRTRSTKWDFEELKYENISSLTLGGITYTDVFKISQVNPEVEPQEIYLAKRLGLIAFVKNDSLWIRE